MTPTRIVDTNLLLRHLMQDHAEQARIAGALIAASDRGEVTLVVLPAVLAECVFVLESYYKRPRQEISAVLGRLITSPGFVISSLAIHLDALERYQATKLHFVDCIIAGAAAAERCPVASFDQGFKQFQDVSVKLD